MAEQGTNKTERNFTVRTREEIDATMPNVSSNLPAIILQRPKNDILDPYMEDYMKMPPGFDPVFSQQGKIVVGMYQHRSGAVVSYNPDQYSPIKIVGQEERVSAALVDLREHLCSLKLIEVKQNGRKND